ncbi:MAG: DNA polymerase III subunit gamma/tau [Oscillospiraceae bacterium]|nr:DNA polymerase III subunit gamma/tau [Oscillospiraceae bacterium]
MLYSCPIRSRKSRNRAASISVKTQTLKTQLQTGKLSHAYLFTGTRGTGKTSCAKILAKAVNCLDPVDGNPCNRCRACTSIDNGSCLDVLEIDAASNNGVDHVRMLRDEAVYTPSEVAKRVYIIDEVHMLSIAAFNALLKIIEEPPAHLMFILATTELHKVPATILSRCQRFSFRRLLQEDIAARLNFIAYEEGIELESEACRLLARLADGGLRDGVSLLDQCASAAAGSVTAELVYNTLGLAGDKRTAQIMDAVARHDAKTALGLFSELYAGGKDLAAMLDELTALSRDLLILKTAPQAGLTMLSGVATDKEALALQEKFSAGELLRITMTLQETASGFLKSADRRVDAELCLLRLCDPKLDLDVGSLNARLSRLEDKLASGSFTVAAAAPTPAAQMDEDDDRPPLPDDADAPPDPDHPSVQMPAPGGDGLPTGFWPDFVAKLKAEVPNKVKGFFAVEGPVKPHMEKSTLGLVAETDFIKNMVDIPQVTEPAARIASALLGRPMQVRCIKRGTQLQTPSEDPFNALVRFGQEHTDVIKFTDKF